MKITLGALLVFLSFQVQAFAAPKAVAFKLLSYKEFSALEREDRAAYIEEMRLSALKTEQEQGAIASNIWISAFLSQAIAASGDMCIYAGYVSKRDSSNRCVAPSGSSGSCGSGKTLCNPLLYGYGPSGSGGFCTSSRSTPTNDCESQYQKLPNYKAYQVADQVVGKDMQKKFDEQSAQLTQYCSTEGAASQKGLCDKLKAKSAYMKQKLEAAEKKKKADAEKAKPEQKATAADAGGKKDDAKPETKSATVTPPATPAAPTTTSKPSPEVSKPSGPAAAPAAPVAPSGAIAPSGGAKATPAEAKPDVAKKDDAKPEVKKNVSPGNCITNKDDFEAKKENLPEDFQKMDVTPIMYAGTETMKDYNVTVTSTMKFSFEKNGKMKVRAAVKTDSMIAGSWVAEDDVASICPSSGGKTFIVTTVDGRKTTVTASGSGIKAATSKGSMNYGVVKSESSFNAQTAAITGGGLALWINNSNTGKTAK